MRQVLLVCPAVAWQNASAGADGPSPGVITVAAGETPGRQAIAESNAAPVVHRGRKFEPLESASEMSTVY